MDSKSILNSLYSNRFSLFIEIKIYGGKVALVPVSLINKNNKPDCCIGYKGSKFYFRTQRGLRSDRYSTIGRLEFAVKNELLKNNITPTQIIVKDNNNMVVYSKLLGV